MIKENMDDVGIELYSRWKEIVLSEITEPIKDTYNPDGSNDFTYIGLEHIEQETLRLNSVGVSSDVTSNKFKFKPNDVLFGKLRPYFRKVVKPQFEGICSTDIWVFRAKKGFDQDFLFYFLANKEFVDTANSGESGSRMPRADWNHLKVTNWNVPPIQEQTAIASILSSLDDKIDLLHRQNKTLEQLAETLFRRWFVEEAGESWETVTLGQFVKTNQRSISKDYQFEEIDYLDTSSLTNGIIIEVQKLTLKDAPSRAKRLVQNNDILISTVRPDQKHYGIINNPKENLVASTGFCVITCVDINPYFVYLLLTNDEMTQYLHSIAEGSTSTYPSLKPSDIEKVEFQKPPEDILNKFGTIATDYWNKININQTQIRTLTHTRDTLLPKLMSGEVRVKM